MSELYLAANGHVTPGDIHLSPAGQEQAMAMGRHFAQRVDDPSRAAILVSPSTATRETGGIVRGLTAIDAFYDHPVLQEIAQSEEYLTASGLHYVAAAVLAHFGHDAPSFDHILVVSHTELMNQFAGRRFDRSQPHFVGGLNGEDQQNLPAMQALGRQLRQPPLRVPRTRTA